MMRARLRAPVVLLAVVAALVVAASCSPSKAEDATSATIAPATTPGTDPVPIDVYGAFTSATYADDGNWLCLPGRGDDPCAGDLDATVVQADGTATVEPGPVADPDAPIDCFYVYPTVSTDPTPNSDMTPGPAEMLAARFQVARLRASCRIFAPVYRQNTLASLGGAAGAGSTFGERMQIAIDDVLDAWKDYITHRNGGRPFVLVGHSQGSQILRSLIGSEILGEPALRSKLVSAIVPGMPGGLSSEAKAGQPEPLLGCAAPDQTGCVITYSSFETDLPPTPNGLWAPALGGTAICTNPAALGGGDHALRAYLASSQFPPFPAGVDRPPVTTPFVAVPGLIHGECVAGDGSRYLSIRVVPQAGDVRSDQIAAPSRSGWGLHGIDVNLALGDLEDLVATQSAAFLAR